MNEHEKVVRGERAKQFLDDPINVEVMAGLRASKLEELATIDPNDKDKIIRLQAIVSVIDEFRGELEGFVLESDDMQRDKPKVA